PENPPASRSWHRHRDRSPEGGCSSAVMNRPRSSRQRYLLFVQDYKHRHLDDEVEAAENQKQIEDPAGETAELPLPEARSKRRRKRRQYLREYLRWLWPHRYAAGVLLVLALTGACLQMVEP